MTDNNTNFTASEGAEQAESRRPYHAPKVVSLGEIHALVMAGQCGCGDAGVACTAS